MKILVSACLLGRPVRYDGQAKTLHDDLLERWRAEGRLVPLCPEVAAGLPTPRAPAEIEPGRTADDVLADRGRVLDSQGNDVSGAFRRGAEIALETARANTCRFALLTDGSPSCVSQRVYDGSFSGTTLSGQGVVAALLTRHGIRVFSERDIAALAEAVKTDA